MSYQESTALTPSKKRSFCLLTLADKLSRSLKKIDRLSRKLAYSSPLGTPKPSFFRRLEKWVEQLAQLRQKETKTLNLIDKIENKHILMRDKKLLRKVRPALKAGMKGTWEDAPNKKKMSFWALVVFLLMLDESKPKPRKILAPELKNG